MRFCLSVAVMTVVVSASSCGVLQFKKSGDIQPTHYASLDEVMLAGLEDTACDAGEQSVAVNRAVVWEWNGQQTISKEIEFTGVNSEDGGLSSSGVSLAIHSYRSESNCKLEGDSPVCDKARKLQNEQVVKICRPIASYQRDSIEGVTLTTQHFVAVARRFYEGLESAKPSLPLAALAIQPQFIKNYSLQNGKVVQLVDSDNAGYAPGDDQNSEGLFAVFPTSKKDFAETGLHLWEVPFVMSHEYGHNIFNHHLAKAAKASGLSIKASIGLDHMINSQNKTVFDAGESRMLMSEKTGATLALSGINELFADLFAFYMNGGKSDLLKGVKCLDRSRDPSSINLGTGKKKIFDSVGVKILAGLAEPLKRASCLDPNFTNEHDVAAILGYPVAQLLNQVMVGSDEKAKVNVLVKSLSDISTYVSKSGKSTSVDGLTASLTSVILSNRTADAAAVTAACTDFKALVPGLEDTVKACE